MSGGLGEIASISCTSPGNCGITGFYEDGSGNTEVMVGLSVNPVSAPTGLSISSSTYLVNGNFRATFDARWYPSSDATSYTCTLLYGYNIPSNFSVTSTSPECSFSGLTLSNSYGISVVAHSALDQSEPTILFASTPKLSTITCRRRNHTTVVTSVSPSCPLGWHPLAGGA